MHPEQLAIYGYPTSSGCGASGVEGEADTRPTCKCGVFAIGQCRGCQAFRCNLHAEVIDDNLTCTECASPATIAAREEREKRLGDAAEERLLQAQARQAAAEERTEKVREGWEEALATFLRDRPTPPAPLMFGITEPYRTAARPTRERPWNRGPKTHPDGTYLGTGRQAPDPKHPRLFCPYYKLFETRAWVLPSSVSKQVHVLASTGRDESPAYTRTETYNPWLLPSGRVLLVREPSAVVSLNGSRVHWSPLWKVLRNVRELLDGSAEPGVTQYPVERVYDFATSSGRI